MAKKNVTLPKNFQALVETGNVADLKAVFDKCELDATGGYAKGTALSFSIPDELVRWLVKQGANINARDSYKRTPLHEKTGRNSNTALFIELGADIEATDQYGDTPLHFAAGSFFNATAVQVLVKNGANVFAKNDYGQSPLEYALDRAGNIDIEKLPDISRLLFEAGVTLTETMQKAISRIGENFEFHRDNFNKDFLPATDTALSQLYEMYEVPPVKRRRIHDGISPITVTATTWKEQYGELWNFLIPGNGAAKTVQGEVIRINGRVTDEKFRNGSCNWDDDFRKMLDALMKYLQLGEGLDKPLFDEAVAIAKAAQIATYDDKEKLYRLCELSVQWVILNSNPIKLEKPEYKR